MRKNVTKLISPHILCTNVTNRVLCRLDRFTVYYNCMRKNVTKLISPRVLCTIVTNCVFSWMTVLRLIKTLWAKVSQNSYLRWVLCISMTDRVLKLLWPFYGLLELYEQKLSQNSYLREICAQVSQHRVFSCTWPFYSFITTVWAKDVTELISPRVLCTKCHKSCS